MWVRFPTMDYFASSPVFAETREMTRRILALVGCWCSPQTGGPMQHPGDAENTKTRCKRQLVYWGVETREPHPSGSFILQESMVVTQRTQ